MNKTVIALATLFSVFIVSCSGRKQLSEGDSLNEKQIGLKDDGKDLYDLQKDFLNLKFGMFIHFNIPTYSIHDWPDPNLSPDVFNPTKLDCGQWADAAVSAGMTYGCLTTKHHSGFCIWDTKTTDYNVMNSPIKKDVVKEYVDAFRKKGLKIFLYYSILDTHHNIRAGWADNRENVDFIKTQLTELLTNYGEITCLVLDGWDAEWSRISYDDIPFKDIYEHVKSIQPNCLICEHNAGKYPASLLFYTDVKQYEQNAGQMISKKTNKIPAQAGIPINKFWFWKEDFPKSPIVKAEQIVYDNLISLNQAHCNFILNVAPNRDGLIDKNVIDELKRVGEIWKKDVALPELEKPEAPVISENIAKGHRMSSSWSLGKRTSDLASDDDFNTCWVAQEALQNHFIEVDFDGMTSFDAVAFVESTDKLKYDDLLTTRIERYEIEYFNGNKWINIPVDNSSDKVRLHRFGQKLEAEKIRINLYGCKPGTGISEFMVYCENE